MDFVCLILFLLMYIFRPQEWIGILSSFHPIQILSVLAAYALLSRDKGIKISDLFKTPHDWLIFAYLGWAVYAASSPWQTFKALQSVILFYVVAVQALSSVPRLKTFLGWWAVSLLIIALLTIGSEHGFDPFGSHDLSEFHMKGRTCLNLSIYNNPNGLGHTLVPVIPMLYFLLFWKNAIGKLSVVFLIFPLWAIYMTQSKGAAIAAFATIVATLTFGRPKAVQIAILCFTGVFGVGALYSLPRMSELNHAKTDAAISGRVAAFTFGYDCMRRNMYGLGLGNFQEKFFANGPLERYQVKVLKTYRTKETHETMVRVWRYRHYFKAPHSSFNQNGAELGFPGFVLFIGVLYSCLRTLVTMSKGTVDEERIRRALFAIVVAYIVSSWMVDFGLRPTFFLFVAATGALHRLILPKTKADEETEAEGRETLPVPLWKQRLLPKPELAVSCSGGAAVLETPLPSLRSKANDSEQSEEGSSINWRRVGVIDLGMISLLTIAALWFWRYTIARF